MKSASITIYKHDTTFKNAMYLYHNMRKIAFKKCFDYNLKKKSILKVLGFGSKEKRFKSA